MTITPAGLSEVKAALLQKYLRGEAPQSATTARSIPRRPSGEDAPLSFGQQQMWLLAQMAPDRPVYTECATVRLLGPLDVTALERSFNEVIRRHEIWRTTFPLVDGEPVQVIQPPTNTALSVAHLEGLPEDEREAEASRLVAADTRVPFDLVRGPLLRPRLMKINDTEHRLYVTLHHIIFDVVSLYSIFLPELAALYKDFSVGKPSSLPEPPIQYADYAYWQRQQLQGEALERHLGYWRERLSDLPVLQLPTDYPQSAVQAFRGAMQRLTLSRTLTDALKELSRREGVTLYMTLVSALITMLHRYTGQDDIIVGTPSSNRDRSEIEQTMGFFLNTLALRTDVSGDPTFREVLQRVRIATVGAQTHQDVPFELVVRDLHPQRSFAQNPLFRVMFTLEPPRPPLDMPWSASMMDVYVGTPKLDLSVELDDTGEGINGRFQYSTDLFDAATIARMVGHFQTLLTAILADPSLPLSQLPLLTPHERQTILLTWNATNTDYPRTHCFPDLFAAQAATTPDALAVLFADQRITYRALDQRANQLAHHLRAHGVGPGRFVGVCIERSTEMLVAVLAVMKAGGAYVPLDPAYPRDRLAFMLDDAQVCVLLTEQRLVATVPAGTATVICIDRDREVIARQASEPPITTTTPEDLAYLIYTSGSTGTPKGVMIPHRALTNFLWSMRQQLDITDHDAVLAATSLSFDIASLELYLPLLVGACAVIVPRDVAAHGRRLAALVESSGATIMQATPTTWRMLFESGWQGNPRLHILCGGEALSQSLAEQLLHAGHRLTNLYGPTETTIWSTLHEVRHADAPIPLGRPIANTQVFILDRHRQLVPIGVPGELFIGGDGLARGYLHRPELSAQRFIPNPFSTEPSARLYATGDQARYRPDGTLEFLGRIDNQVKMRGYRIEPGEIESLLERHEGVREAVVMAREDVPGSESLVAYIVPTRSSAPTAGELRRVLAAQLPDYMVPSAFVSMDMMPVTPNGKIDRHALPAPNAPDSVRDAPFVPPAGILQLQLARIWEEVLGVQPVGITDDFFDLGGTSLLAARLVDRIADVCGREIPLTSFFSGATIEQMEAVLLERKDQEISSPVVLVQEGKEKRRFFFLHGDLEDGGIYCIKLARALDPDRPFYAIHPSGVDGGPIPHTVEAIAAEHLEALRTVQPEGPYLLGGYCNGALFAFEMARQLQAQGQRVEALVLIEPGRARPSVRGFGILIGWWGKLTGLDSERQIGLYLSLRARYIEKSRRSLSPGWIKAIETFDSMLRKCLEALARVLVPRDRQLLIPSLLPKDHPENARSRAAFALQYRYSWAANRYVPQRYRGRAAMYQASEEQKLDGSDPTQGWKDLVDDIDVSVTPGSHFSSITTHVEALTEQMRMWLDAGDEAPIKLSMVDGR